MDQTAAQPAAHHPTLLVLTGPPDAPLPPRTGAALAHLAEGGNPWQVRTTDDINASWPEPAPAAVLCVTAERGVVAAVAQRLAAETLVPALVVIWLAGPAPAASELQAADVVPLADLTPALLERALRYAVQRQRLEREVAFLAQHDALTGLANQDLFTRQVRHAVHVARRNNRELAVYCVRIDNFQDLVEGLGTTACNALISAFGARLTELLRRSDLVARAGDQEFLVLLDNVADHHELAQAADKLRTGLAERFVLPHCEAFLSVSIGMAVFPRSAEDGDALMAAARTAADRAAARGGNEFCLFDAELATVSRRRLRMEEALPHALGQKEFAVYYQPQYCLHTRQLVGAEALLRWHGQDLGRVDPEVFIPVAEETGAILRIGEWVLQQACSQARDWHTRLASAVRISVNVSGRQFRDQRILHDIRNLLASTGLDPQLLEVELTERVFVQNIGAHRAVFDGLRDLGVQVALDDFGIGYSSLAYLKNFPVDCLKIDKSFVQHLPDSRDDLAIVRAILAMGHSLGMRIVAEGIETQAQLACLQAEGCDEVQGYLLGRPVPAEEFGVALLGEPELPLDPAAGLDRAESGG